MSRVSLDEQLKHIGRIEDELFRLIEKQIADKVDLLPYNWERAKHIDSLQDSYAKYLLK